MLPKLNAHVKSYGCIFYWKWWITRKIWRLWNNISNSIKKEIECEPIYNKKFLETKSRSYGNEVADFQYKEKPKVDHNYTCLAGILIKFIFKDKNYFPQVFLKECEYIEKEK